MYLIKIRSMTTRQKEIDLAYSMHEATVIAFSTDFPVRPESITNSSFPFATFMGPLGTGKGIVIEKSLLLTNSSSPRGSLRRPSRLSFYLSLRHMVSRISVRGAFPDWPGPGIPKPSVRHNPTFFFQLL
jgi:hypothetical protein